MLGDACPLLEVFFLQRDRGENRRPPFADRARKALAAFARLCLRDKRSVSQVSCRTFEVLVPFSCSAKGMRIYPLSPLLHSISWGKCLGDLENGFLSLNVKIVNRVHIKSNPVTLQ